MNDKINIALNDVIQLRDELLLKAELGKLDAKEQLEKLEPAFALLKKKSQKISNVAGNSAEEIRVATEMGIKADNKEDIHAALELASDELKKSYEKIKHLLQE